MKTNFVDNCLANSLGNVTISNPAIQSKEGIILCHVTSRTGGGEISVLQLFALAKEYYHNLPILAYIRATTNVNAVNRIERLTTLTGKVRVLYYGSRSLEQHLSIPACSARSLLSTPEELAAYEGSRSLAEMAILGKKAEMNALVEKYFPDRTNTRQARITIPILDRTISKQFRTLPDADKARILDAVGLVFEQLISAELGGAK